MGIRGVLNYSISPGGKTVTRNSAGKIKTKHPKIHYTPTVTALSLHFGEVHIGRTVVLNLTYTELKVLAVLHMYNGEPVTVQTLLQRVWRGVGTESRSKVIMAISRLRTKLKKYGVKIKAVHGEGYYL